MAFIPTPDTARCALAYIANGQECVNTLWFKHLANDPSTAELFVLGNALLEWYKTELRPQVSHDVVLRDITVTSQASDSAPSITVTVPAADSPGTNIESTLPNNVTLCVSFRSADRGRSARGRNYTIGAPRNSSTGNQFSPGFCAFMQTAYFNLMDIAEAAGWTWGVVSHRHNKVWLTEGVFRQVIAVVVVDANVDSQRRRLTGRGT